ncbi:MULTISPECIES: hypothetical protein [Mesorhizobium]|uniref:Uncharacterized protein n=1 Tax=Mesorhizobium qingshengii TaxID=1165689 RepID=A0A1G5ZY43_9HYPH|nr:MULTISPECIES: hypothetical protein [Mesorhizobium]MCH4561147.1 hypothetical protein [Mesorhizobium jarvisii]QGU21027.1 hypothetical protein MCHK_12655 [Mesorhizobium huakuii 7653R]SDA99612.1 hypothetical protein SAMN02927914_06642 [Mesorhizobium qingshengii]
MSQVHGTQIAQRFLSVMRSTQSDERLEFCFAVGTIVIAGEKKPVVLVRKKGLTSLRRTLEDMRYKTPKGVQEPIDFKFLRSGTGRMNQEGVIVVRLAKGGMAKFMAIKTQMRRYFKDLRVSLPDIQEAEPLSEEDLNRFEIAAQANSDDLPSDENQEVVKENVAEGAPESLSEGLKQTIATSAASIAAHSNRISRQTGLMQTAELGPLTNKIADWLKAILTATPLEERENALHNFTCRLLLMLAYDDNRRNLQYVDEAPDGDEMQTDRPTKPDEAGVDDGAEREAIVIDGIDLERVSKDLVDQDEVVETLFRMTKAEAQERRLPYPLETASSDRLAMLVSSKWPKEEGNAANRCDIVERLIAVVEQQLGNDNQLIALLGLNKIDKLEEDFATTVRSMQAKWQVCREAVLVHWEDTKSKINKKYDVEALGGTWKSVDEIILKVNDAVSNQLSALNEQEAELKVGVIARGEAIVESILHDLNSNQFIQLLDNPPAAFAPIPIGETLREGIGSVGSELKRIKASLAAAAPAA